MNLYSEAPWLPLPAHMSHSCLVYAYTNARHYVDLGGVPAAQNWCVKSVLSSVNRVCKARLLEGYRYKNLGKRRDTVSRRNPLIPHILEDCPGTQ